LEGGLTTSLILGWVAIFCLAFTGLCVVLTQWRDREKRDGRKAKTIDHATLPLVLPALAIAPLCIFLSWLSFRVNLIFPVFEFTGTVELIKASLAPALILFIGSGLPGRIFSTSRSEWAFWSGKPFVKVEDSLGKNPRRRLRPLVARRTLLQSASDCLPLVFSELVIIESIFNAPGLGYWSWEFAKAREASSAAQVIAVLFLVYALINVSINVANKRLGKKLAGYV
jgi:ABC-type dipeptide/oligopeptide/nickel transport system permease component